MYDYFRANCPTGSFCPFLAALIDLFHIPFKDSDTMISATEADVFHPEIEGQWGC